MDLYELSTKVAAAAGEANRPPSPGESLPFTLPVDHLDEAGLALLWEAAHALRQHDPALVAVLPQSRLANLIVDQLEANPELDVPRLAAALGKHAAEEGPWLVETWLMHAEMPAPWVPLTQGTALLRASRERDVGRSDEDADALFEAYK